MQIRATHITAGYGSQRVLHDVAAEIRTGEIVGIIGPNGCGKSTLLKVLAGLLRPSQGQVTLDERPLRQWNRAAFARQVAVLPQSPVAPAALTVRELVAMGRHPHARWYRRQAAADFRAINHAIDQCELESLVDRKVQTLSGGERQRAWLAMSLAQQPAMLLLDEPTSALDINHQLELLELLKRLNRQREMTICMVMHDLNQTFRYCDRLIAMKAGRVRHVGTPDELLGVDAIFDVFGVLSEVMQTSQPGHRILGFHLPN